MHTSSRQDRAWPQQRSPETKVLLLWCPPQTPSSRSGGECEMWMEQERAVCDIESRGAEPSGWLQLTPLMMSVALCSCPNSSITQTTRSFKTLSVSSFLEVNPSPPIGPSLSYSVNEKLSYAAWLCTQHSSVFSFPLWGPASSLLCRMTMQKC